MGWKSYSYSSPHSNPATAREFDDETDPGVKNAIIQMDEEPHSGWSAISLACIVTSVGDKFEHLRFDPAKRFEILQQEVILGKLSWQLDTVVTTVLWDPSHGLSNR